MVERRDWTKMMKFRIGGREAGTEVDQLVIKFEASGVQLGTGQIAWTPERMNG